VDDVIREAEAPETSNFNAETAESAEEKPTAVCADHIREAGFRQ